MPPDPRIRAGARTELAAADVVAAQLLRRGIDLGLVLDERTRKLVESRLAGLLPGDVIQPGRVAPPRIVPPDDLQSLIPTAAVTAAGLDPARTPNPPPAVLWQDGGNELLVDLAHVRAVPGDGLVDVIVPVRCDQTGAADVTVTFVTGSEQRAAGGLAVTEDRPRGPREVVENWHEALIAFAWHTLLGAMAAVTHAAGSDPAGRPLVVADVIVSRQGLTLVPMARHVFDRSGNIG